MRKPEIVEVYSAADPVDAHAIANMLIEEGINAQVVGDALSTGAFPVSDPQLSARVWVDSAHAGQARQFVEDWERRRVEEETEQEPDQQQDAAPAGEEVAAPEADAGAVSEEPETAQSVQTRQLLAAFLSRLLMALGLVTIAVGLVWGTVDWQLRATYPEIATARLISTPDQLVETREVIEPGRYRWFAEYEYQVEQQPFRARLALDFFPPDRLNIRHSREQPADYYGPEVAHPAWPAALGLLVGGLLIFVGWQFRA